MAPFGALFLISPPLLYHFWHMWRWRIPFL